MGSRQLILYVLSGVIVLLAVWVSIGGLFGADPYAGESVNVAAQARGLDAVTLFFAVPALAIFLVTAMFGTIRGMLAHAGILAYFVYTYAGYALGLTVNRFFLVYVILFSVSFFAFLLALRDVLDSDIDESVLWEAVIKTTAAVLILVGIGTFSVWIGPVWEAVTGGTPQIVIDTEGHLAAQTLDLGLVAPASVLVGILLLRKNLWGLIFAPILMIKNLAQVGGAVAMTFVMAQAGSPASAGRIVLLAVSGIVLLIVTVWLYISLKWSPGVY